MQECVMPDTPVDPGHDADGNPFDSDKGLFGQEYSITREQALGHDLPSGTVAAKPDARQAPNDPAIPSENGRRASFDPRTGAVHGSGSSAGGGNPGEDFDSDSASGDGYPIDGSEGRASRAPTDLGPPHFNE